MTLELIWQKIKLIEVNQRQQNRLLQAVLTAQSQSSSMDDTLPDGITLPCKSLSELFEVDKKLQESETFKKMVTAFHI